MNSLMMKSKGEGSSRSADLEHSSRKRTPGDLSAGEGSQVRDPKKTKMEIPVELLSDLVRIVDGFGSDGGGDEVVNLRKALEQSEKEKTVLREELSLLVSKTMNENFEMKLQLEQAEKDKADMSKQVELVHKLYKEHTEARLRLEEKQVLLMAEFEELKARADKWAKIELAMAKDGTTNTFEEHVPT